MWSLVWSRGDDPERGSTQIIYNTRANIRGRPGGTLNTQSRVNTCVYIYIYLYPRIEVSQECVCNTKAIQTGIYKNNHSVNEWMEHKQ